MQPIIPKGFFSPPSLLGGCRAHPGPEHHLSPSIFPSPSKETKKEGIGSPLSSPLPYPHSVPRGPRGAVPLFLSPAAGLCPTLVTGGQGGGTQPPFLPHCWVWAPAGSKPAAVGLQSGQIPSQTLHSEICSVLFFLLLLLFWDFVGLFFLSSLNTGTVMPITERPLLGWGGSCGLLLSCGRVPPPDWKQKTNNDQNSIFVSLYLCMLWAALCSALGATMLVMPGCSSWRWGALSFGLPADTAAPFTPQPQPEAAGGATAVP